MSGSGLTNPAGQSRYQEWSASHRAPRNTAAAAAAAVATALGALGSSVLAESSLHASPLAAAQASVNSAWEEVSEDLHRLNARLPRRSIAFVGRRPQVSALGENCLEVMVPLREGADANAVLAELEEGFAIGKAGSRSSIQTSCRGPSCTVHLDVQESSRGNNKDSPGHVTARLQLPIPGSSEHGCLVVAKHSPQGFTQQELESLKQLVRTANLSFAPPQRHGQGPFAGGHSFQSSIGGSIFDDMQQGDVFGDVHRMFEALIAGGMQQAMSDWVQSMQPLGALEEGDEVGGVFDRVPQQRSLGKKDFPKEEGGHDWGSPQAAQAVKQLQSMGAQVYPPGRKGATNWGGLAGYEEQKRMIEDCLLLPLLRPDVFDSVTKATRQAPTSNRPRAVLFEGPPGTGKTTSARVISSQASVPLVYVPLEAVMSKWFGESEGLLAKVFKAAEALGGAIIFIDELDSLGGNRERGDMHEASRRLLSVLLREMDGFDAAGKKAVIIGATNRKADLDPALMSRFDLSIKFGIPDESCRALILKQYAKQLKPDELKQLAAAAGPSASGRDLRDLCEHAERRWASKIIRKEAAEGSLPPLKEYLASAAERRATVTQSSTRPEHPFSFLPPR